MKTEIELFENWFKSTKWFTGYNCTPKYITYRSMLQAWQASAQREGYKLVPVEPTEEMYSELSRHLCRYMQMHDRYCPKTLGKYISRFIGFKSIPDWLNKEVPDWDSDHAFATADMGVFIYKAMIGAAE